MESIKQVFTREFINKHGKWVAGGLLVLALLLALLLTRSSLRNVRENPSYGFYVDEETGVETVHPATEVPPLDGKAGRPTVVRAFKFTCDNGQTVTVGYYMKYPVAVRDQIKNLDVLDQKRIDLLDVAEFVRLPQANSPWVKAQSDAGQKIKLGPPCSTGTLRMVHPVP